VNGMDYEDILAAFAAAVNWRKATYSGGENGGCVEVAYLPGFVGVRDTKLGECSPVLAFTDTEWKAFVAGVKDKKFDLAHASRSSKGRSA
jgi:hypothetical protein